MGYRDRPSFWKEPLKPHDRKSTLWSLAGILTFNIGILAADAARRFGWNVNADTFEWLAIGLGFACLGAGVVAYRSARAQAERDIEEMMPPNYRG